MSRGRKDLATAVDAGRTQDTTTLVPGEWYIFTLYINTASLSTLQHVHTTHITKKFQRL